MKTVERRGEIGKCSVLALVLAGALGGQAAVAQELPAQDPTQLIWLAGHWVQQSERGRSDEVWLAPTAAGMVGLNQQAFARGGRFFEFLRIEPLAGRLSYMASPMGRNPTVFGLESAGPCTVAFINPAHDFPQRIEYRREGAALIASIAGVVRGEPRQSQWRWQLESGGDASLCGGAPEASGTEMPIDPGAGELPSDGGWSPPAEAEAVSPLPPDRD